jgi:hypothetical protein
VATANKMVLHAVQSNFKTKTFPWHGHLLSQNIDSHGSNLLGDFQIYFVKTIKVNSLNVVHSLSTELFVALFSTFLVEKS